MKSFAGFMAIVGLAIFLTKGSDVKRSCKNDAVAYFVASQHAKTTWSKSPDVTVDNVEIPPIHDVDIEHRYLGGCRHVMRGYLTADEVRVTYDVTLLGFREEGGEHIIESFTLYDPKPAMDKVIEPVILSE